MKYRAGVLILVAILASFAALGVLRRPTQDATSDSKTKPEPPEQKIGETLAPRKTSIDGAATAPASAKWRTAVLAKLPKIAGKLPDLATVSVEKSLRSYWLPTRRMIDGRTNGKLTSLVMADPELSIDIQYRLPLETESEDAFRLLSRLLVTEVVAEEVATNPEQVLATLMEIIDSPASALGDTEDAKSVFRALQWSAASTMTSIPLTPEIRSRLEQIASRPGDDVLRGNLVGALIAFRSSDDFVTAWMAKESSSRAVQALLVSLTRQNTRNEFPEDGDATYTVIDGTMKLTSKGTMTSTGIPSCGKALGHALVDLLKRQDFVEEEILTSGNALGDKHVPLRVQTPIKKPGGVVTYETSDLTDVRSMALEALGLRMSPELVAPLSQVLDQAATVKSKTGIIELIARMKSAEAERLLASYASDQGRTVSERGSALGGLSRQGSPAANAAVESFLWDAAPRMRVAAAACLHYSEIPITEKANQRIVWLAANEPDPEMRAQYVRILKGIQK